MSDQFRPRRFQAELRNSVAQRVVAQETATVAYVAPGSGKTLGWQAVVTDLMRTGHISTAAVFVPRTNLAIAAETDYRAEGTDGTDEGDFLLFESKRLERVRHRRNAYPLLPHNVIREAYTTCYASLASYPDLHLDWARKHEGDFLLVADEAQFCGQESNGMGLPGSTRAGEYIQQMAQVARHTLLLTGSHKRADGRPLVLADYLPNPKDPKRKKLVSQVEANYSDGVALCYLRDFEVCFKNAPVNLRNTENADTFDGLLSDPKLYEYMGSIKNALRREDVWQPVVDEVVDRVREAQKVKQGYRGLIACMEQMDARRIVTYLGQRHRDLRVELAVSSDEGEALRALRRFKGRKDADPDEKPPADILVTVRMAFIGYDCKQIGVVGVLTNYRDSGHLLQLIGRGLRMWGGAPSPQLIQIVTTDDPAMKKFVAWLRTEADKGLKEREEREGSDFIGDPGSWEIASIGPATTRIENRGGAIPPAASEKIAEALRTVGPVTTTTQAIELMGQLGFVFPDDPAETIAPAPAPAAPPRTEAEIVAHEKGKASKLIGGLLYRKGFEPSHGNYQQARAKITRSINDVFGIRSTEAITTKEDARRYLATVRDWISRHDVQQD